MKFKVTPLVHVLIYDIGLGAVHVGIFRQGRLSFSAGIPANYVVLRQESISSLSTITNTRLVHLSLPKTKLYFPGQWSLSKNITQEIKYQKFYHLHCSLQQKFHMIHSDHLNLSRIPNPNLLANQTNKVNQNRIKEKKRKRLILICEKNRGNRQFGIGCT